MLLLMFFLQTTKISTYLNLTNFASQRNIFPVGPKSRLNVSNSVVCNVRPEMDMDMVYLSRVTVGPLSRQSAFFFSTIWLCKDDTQQFALEFTLKQKLHDGGTICM